MNLLIFVGAFELQPPTKSCGFAAVQIAPLKTDVYPPPKFNIAPENRESLKETHLPTIHFQGLC